MESASYPRPSSKIVPSQSRVFLVPSSVLHLLCFTFTCVMLARCAPYYDRATGAVVVVFTSLLFVVIVIALVVSVMRLTKRFTDRLKPAGIILSILALLCDSVAVGTFAGLSLYELWFDGTVDVFLALGLIMFVFLLIICCLQIADHRRNTSTGTTTGTRLAAAVELEQHQEGVRLAASSPLRRPSSEMMVPSQSRVFLVPSSILQLLCFTFTCVMLAGCSGKYSSGYHYVIQNTGWAKRGSTHYGPSAGCDGAAAGDVTIAFTSLLFVVIVIAFVVSAMRLTKGFSHRLGLKRAGIILPILALLCDSVAVGTFTGSSCMVDDMGNNSTVDVSLVLGFTMIPVLLIICDLEIAEHLRNTSTGTTTGARLLADAVEPEQHQDDDRLAAAAPSCVVLVPSSVLHLLCFTFTCVMLAGCSTDSSVTKNTGWAHGGTVVWYGYDYDLGYINYNYGPASCDGAAGDVTTAFTSLLFVVIVIAFVVSAMRLTKKFSHRLGLKRAGMILPILALLCDSVAVGTFFGGCMTDLNGDDSTVHVSFILGFTMIPVLLIILALHIVAHYKTTGTATSGGTTPATTVSTTATTTAVTTTPATTNNNDEYVKQLEARLAVLELAQSQLQQQEKCPPTYFNSPVVVGTTGI